MMSYDYFSTFFLFDILLSTFIYIPGRWENTVIFNSSRFKA